MEQSKISPTKGHVVPGVVINPFQFSAGIPGAQLFQLVVDPRRTEDQRLVAEDPTLAAVREVRMEVQRLFEGAKKKNVPAYADYISMVQQGQPGLTPSIILWSKELLEFEESDAGTAILQVPFDAQLIAIDGETQLAARFEAARMNPATKADKIAVMFCHGRPAEWARQAFHDVNTYGVRPNAALAIGMDARDPLTAVARELEIGIPFFAGRVNAARRQLGKRDKEVVTITALRGACVTFAEGISGVKYGAKPVYVKPEDVKRTRALSLEWFSAVVGLLGPAIEDRERKVAGAPPVLAAVGALGHELLEISDAGLRARRTQELIEQLRAVRWEKGQHWVGVAGKMTAKGRFSIGGTKEVAYQVFNALSDSTDPGYAQVRKLEGAAR